MSRELALVLPEQNQPMTIGGFMFHGRTVTPVGTPSPEGFERALLATAHVSEVSPWWVGGLVAYAENRGDWDEVLEHAMSLTGWARATLLNLGWLYRASTETVRNLAPSPAHLKKVAKLSTDEQRVWLEKARAEELTTSELEREVKASARRAVIEGQPVLAGKHRVLMADPPWSYQNAQPSGSTSARHYPTLTVEELCALPVRDHVMADAVLGFWVPGPLLGDNPGPFHVIEAWGFTYKAFIAWDKVEGAGGHYTDGGAELFLICTRGSCTPDVPTGLPHSVITARKSRVHSEKPPEFRQLLEKHWTLGPYLELFGREPVEGWSVFGNDAALW